MLNSDQHQPHHALQAALFDLDNTLLAGDSDVAWGQFVVDEGWVDPESHARDSAAFHSQYEAGDLDIRAFQRFTLAPLFGRPWSEIKAARERFVSNYIQPIVAPHARALMAHHAHANHLLVIVTATNSLIAEPIADLLGIDTLLATEPEFADGGVTGEITGTPTYREGKIQRVHDFFAARDASIERTYFYSDSHNDLPLMRYVDHPVAVDADPTLAAEAHRANWPSISLRGAQQPAFADLAPERAVTATDTAYSDQRSK